MHRLFFALWPDDALRRDIAEVATQRQGAGARAVRSDRYHMTLHFLGDCEALPATTCATLLAAADAIQAPGPFDVLLDRIGSFDAGRVAWLGCSAVPAPLSQLHRQLCAAFADARIGSTPATGFVPHVTVGRGARRMIDGPIAPLRWRVADFVLIDSAGGEYRRLGRWPLSRG